MAKLIHKNMPEPYFMPTPGKIKDDTVILGGIVDDECMDRPFDIEKHSGNQWGEDKHIDAGGGDRFSRSVNAFHGGTGLWGVMAWAIEKGR